jgi:hypothetical protein
MRKALLYSAVLFEIHVQFCGKRLTLRELRATAGTAETWLLPLFHAGVAGQEALLAKLLGKVAVVSHQSAGDALHAGTSLTGAAAAMDADHDIDTIANAGMLERSYDSVLILKDREIMCELALVDRQFAAAGANPHAGDRGFTATSSEGVDDFFCSGHVGESG